MAGRVLLTLACCFSQRVPENRVSCDGIQQLRAPPAAAKRPPLRTPRRPGRVGVLAEAVGQWLIRVRTC